MKVAATQAGNANYNAAPNVTNTYTVASTPYWTSIPISNATESVLYTYTLAGVDPGGLPITFRTNSVPPWLTLSMAGGSPIISTFAGTGVAGTPTNGYQAANSAIKSPNGVAYDKNGNAYIADYSAYYVYKVTPLRRDLQVRGQRDYD